MTDQATPTRPDDGRALIPLSNLVEGKYNVRRTDKKADAPSLAADILAHGLLQNLLVTAKGDGSYGVEGGGRRLAALKLLAKRKDIEPDHLVPCVIVTEDEAREKSLAENVHQVAMNAMDEMEAFAKLIDEGAAIEDVARRYGKTVRHVEQRLALGRLSARIRNAYRKCEISLDAARAFCITDDHATQERAFKSLSKPITSAQAVRHVLTQDRIPADHKLAQFVGIDAYRTAGGRVTQDLFEDSVTFLDDGDVLMRLATEKAEALRDTVLAEGWSWVEVQLGHGQIEGCTPERLRPGQRKLTAKEKKAIAALEAEIEAIDAALDEVEDQDAAWEERERAEAKLHALRESTLVWDPALMQHAGAGIGVDRDGTAVVLRGLIKRADSKTIDKLRRKAEPHADADAADSAEAVDIAEPRDPATRLTKDLVQRLTQARTRALRAEIAARPHVALALLVQTMGQRSFFHAATPGVQIASDPLGFDDEDKFERDRIPLGEGLPDDPPAHFATCLTRPLDELVAALALLVAETLDFTHRATGPGDRHVQAMSDALAAALDLDMARHWEPDQDFWEKAPKAMALAALETAPSITKLTAKKRAIMRAAFAKMKKAELARAAAKHLRGAGWLPDIIVTPTREAAFAATSAGEAALAHSDAA